MSESAFSSSASTRRLQTLRELLEQAQRAAQEIAVAVKRAQLEQQRAEAKLQNLHQYGEQYRRQLLERERAGAPWSQVRDLRGFLDRLAAAQAAQRDEVERNREQCAEQLRAWTSARQKEKAYEVLLAQEQGVALAHQRRRQQADFQEWSLNRRPAFGDSAVDTQGSRFGDTGTTRR